MWVLFYYSGFKVSAATLNIPQKEKCAFKIIMLFFVLFF